VNDAVKKKPEVDYRVFLSHSHKDRWIAKQCARLIEEAAKPRVEVFFDEKDIEGGQSIPDSVRTGIEKCDELVVLLSRYSKERLWVLIEVGAAWGLRKPIHCDYRQDRTEGNARHTQPLQGNRSQRFRPVHQSVLETDKGRAVT
jgi:hypothetical protein